MPSMLLVIASLSLTILAWGVYGPTLHHGQDLMSIPGEGTARLRPFACVGFAYFLIGVLVPIFVLVTRGEKGGWTARGVITSLIAGVLGAFGALGIVLALSFGGKPLYVMPLVFGGAPVVNAFVTIYLAKRMKEISPIFLAGLVMVVLGAVTVLLFKPSSPPKAQAQPAAEVVETEETPAVQPETIGPRRGITKFTFQMLAIALTICCWGSYGPTLHKGQAAMNQSRMRPMLCVGLSYFAVAVIIPFILISGPLPEASEFNFWGTLWSTAGGACGALGALGIIMSFNFGGRPVYVMPLVFSGAPVVNTFVTILIVSGLSDTPAWQLACFLAGLMLVILGSAMVLVFAPKGPPPSAQKKASEAPKPAVENQEPASHEPAPPADPMQPTDDGEPPK